MLSKSISFSGFISAALYTWGLCNLLLKSYMVPVTPIVALFLALIILAAICFAFYNRVTVTVLFAVFLPIFALTIITDRSYTIRVIEGIYSFGADIISFFLRKADSSYLSDRAMMICGLICLIIALPSIFLFSRLRGAFILGVAGFGVYMYVWMSGLNSYYIELCAIICSVITVSAGSYARARAALNKDRIYEKTLFSYASAREHGIREGSILAATVLPITLCVSALMLLIIPDSVYPMHSIAFETFVDDMVDLTGIYSGATRKRIFFDMTEFGYNRTLGGPVTLSDDPVYVVSMSAPSLYRVSVKDTYNGFFWDVSEEASVYRFDYNMAAEIRKEIFLEYLPEGYTPEAIYIRAGGIAGPSVVTFTLICPGPRSELLHAGRPTRFVSETIDEFIPYFDTNSEVFSKRLLYEGDSYTAYEVTLPFTNNRFNNFVIACEDRLSKEKASGMAIDANYEAVRARYLDLPDNIEPWIYAFAKEVTSGQSTYYKKAMALRNAISERSIYTLSPREVPANREFVAWFLETREGYCNYYATALAVLARCAGIPSRYVEGFSTFSTRPRPNGSYIITGKEAHSWCEIYIEGVGWIPMDATIGFYSASGASAADDLGDDWSLIEFGDVEYDLDADGVGIKLPPGSALVITAAILTLTLVTLLVLTRRIRRLYSLKWLRKRYGMGEILLIYWRDIRKLMPLIGIEPVVGESPSREAVRLTDMVNNNSKYSGVLYADRRNLTKIAKSIERYVYGEIEPGIEELETLYALHRRLDAALMIQLLPVAYISQRRKWTLPSRKRAKTAPA